MFEPILRYLPLYLSRDPLLRPALRLVAPSPATYRIRDGRLTIAWDGQKRRFDLSEHTLYSLVQALRRDGFQLAWADPQLYGFGAAILWDGDGVIDDRDGTELAAWTSVLHALTRPVELEWVRVRDATPDAARQVSFATAERDWLDAHGAIYGIPRPTGMADTAYRAHLLAEILRPRGNARGIEATIRRRLGADIRVIEPWQWLARWDVSALSGDHHLQDGVRWAKNLLHLASHLPGDWAQAQAIAQADRDAGCLLLDPAWWPLARAFDLGSGDPAPSITRSQTRVLSARRWYHPVWSVSVPSDYEIIWDFLMMAIRWETLYVDGEADRPRTRLDQKLNFCRGDAVFSEDSPLGDLNTRFRGAWYYQVAGAARRASDDLALSAYQVERSYRPICEWTEAPLAATPALPWPFRPSLERGRRHHRGIALPGKLGRAAARGWGAQSYWDHAPWMVSDAYVGAHTKIRICEQQADGATPIWSDGGPLSDYRDGISCRELTYDPADGITYPDPYTGQIITIPPRRPRTQRLGVYVCWQRPDGLTPVLSDKGGLSDYKDGILCEIRYTDPLAPDSASPTSPTPTPAPPILTPAQSPALRADQVAVSICRQLADAMTPSFSGDGRLSDYFDRLYCERVVVDGVISAALVGSQVVLLCCEQRPDGVAPSFSQGPALSDYQDGFVCRQVFAHAIVS